MQKAQFSRPYITSILPESGQLAALLELKSGQNVADLVSHALLEPLGEFLERPGKNFRGQLVELGFRLSAPHGAHPVEPAEKKLCLQAAQVVEAIHAASLIVDDIQDQSQFRRGEPSLHLVHGLPLALNAGNWLYFWPFERIRSWHLPETKELEVYRLCHQALLRAHFGQALDLGVGIDTLEQSRVSSVCLASLELKTGALTGLAICLGAALGGAPSARQRELSDFGQQLGVSLQMFDDLGNLKGNPREGKADLKRLEDLRLRRPSWVWATAATYPSDQFQEFLKAVRLLPDESALTRWVESTQIEKVGKENASKCLRTAIETLTESLAAQGNFHEPLCGLNELITKLKEAYV